MSINRYNLLTEPWLKVLNLQGETESVSLKELFQRAPEFLDLAGDMKTQDFAVLRILLAILHTVFSRFNAQGKVYEEIELDERLRQVRPVDEDDLDDYYDALMDTWEAIWQNKQFPTAVLKKYFDEWQDHFYLFSDEYPFMQVTEDELVEMDISYLKSTPLAEKITEIKLNEIEKRTGLTFMRLMNRTVTESEKTIDLFRPKSKDTVDNVNSEGELIRWLIMYHAYTGKADKAKFYAIGKNDKEVTKYEQVSGGWIFELSGIYLKGDSLFETLMLNFYLASDGGGNLGKIQSPCWEVSVKKFCQQYLSFNKKKNWFNEISQIDNIATLYTFYSRLIYLNPKMSIPGQGMILGVKLPGIRKQDNFIEPMTLWEFHDKNKFKGSFTPKKYDLEGSLWREFGLLADVNLDNSSDRKRLPGIIEWLAIIDQEINVKKKHIKLVAVGMENDGEHASYLPIQEIFDELNIAERVLMDFSDEGWLVRINNVVMETKNVVDNIYQNYLFKIASHRNLRKKRSNSNKNKKFAFDLFIENNLESAYSQMNQPFKQWLSSIKFTDSKDVKVIEWKKQCSKLITQEAKKILKSGTIKDFKLKTYTDKNGDECLSNIAIAYDQFEKQLNNKFMLS